MALPSSGSSISLNQMHLEVIGASGTECSINDADIRNLIGKSAGVQMSFSEWHGASAADFTDNVYNVVAYNNSSSRAKAFFNTDGTTTFYVYRSVSGPNQDYNYNGTWATSSSPFNGGDYDIKFSYSGDLTDLSDFTAPSAGAWTRVNSQIELNLYCPNDYWGEYRQVNVSYTIRRRGSNVEVGTGSFYMSAESEGND